jgi:translation initiation factor 1 (eIF-1/SUI1)
MIYINGIKASKADIKRLLKDLKNGKQRATAHTTRRGNLAIVTEF